MTLSSSAMESLLSQLRDLERKVTALESKQSEAKLRGPTTTVDRPPLAQDAFTHRMLALATAAGFKQILFTRCPESYYDWTLEQRRSFLKAPSTSHLTKSIVFENTRFNGTETEDASNPLRSRYLCCIVPYTHKIDSDALRSIIRRMHERKGLPMPSAKTINYRLAGDCLAVTGYEPNAVTPLGLRTRMPVVITRAITELNPPEFWLGGGEVSLKWNVQLDEFLHIFDPLIVDIM